MQRSRGSARARAAGRNERPEAVCTGEADEAVDHPGCGVRLSEFESKELGHEIELGKCNEPPVERANDDQRRGETVHELHSVHLL